MKRRRVVRRRITDEEHRLMVAGSFAASRIVSGVAPLNLLEQMGWRYKDLPWRVRMRMSAAEWAAVKLFEIEQSFADGTGRLSTLQRYARALGLKADPKLFRLRRLPVRQELHKMGAKKKQKARAFRFSRLL